MGAQLLFELPARAFFALLEGAQRYDVYQLIEFARSADAGGRSSSRCWSMDLGLPGARREWSPARAARPCARRASPRTRSCPSCRSRRRYVSRERFRALFTFGGEYFLVRLMGTLYRQMDKVIVGIGLGLR